MKKLLTEISPIVVLFFLLSTNGCKCDDISDPNCSNYDPCHGESANFGDFYMEERLYYNGDGVYIKTDTTLERNDIRFTVYDNEVDSVKWLVGADPTVRTGNSITLFFEEAYGAVEITSIVYKQKAEDCISGNDGIDTVRKTLQILEWWQAPYFGTFSGTATEEPNTVFETIIDTISNYRGAPDLFYTTLLTNFPDGYSMPIPTDGSQNEYHPWSIIGYNGFILLVNYDLRIVRATYKPKSKELNFEYYFDPKDGSDWQYKKHYSGTKVD